MSQRWTGCYEHRQHLNLNFVGVPQSENGKNIANYHIRLDLGLPLSLNPTNDTAQDDTAYDRCKGGGGCLPPVASSSIFNMDRGPKVVLMMSATAYESNQSLAPI